MSDMPDTDAVLLALRGPVAWITLNRPAAMNAINNDIRERFPQAIREAMADEGVRVIVVTGASERAFCTGADVKELKATPMAPREAGAENWIDALYTCPLPVIAAIRGYCLGGGLEIALACDLRVAAEGAVFGFPEVGLGLITGVGGSQRLLRTVGLSRATQLLLTGERIDAATAEHFGLIGSVVPAEQLVVAAEKLALELADKPPAAVRSAKEVLQRGWDLDIASGRALETELLSRLVMSGDRRLVPGKPREKTELSTDQCRRP